jgi:glycosyltransferase involved in cell wall biosynthesis
MSGTVHVVVPEGVDDPTRPSGGNVYDRRLCDELGRAGWSVVEHVGPSLAEVPDDAVVLVDGLVAVDEPDAVVSDSERVRVVVLLHMPFGESDRRLVEPEAAVLAAARAVVTTSEWSRGWVVEHHDVAPDRVVVARPGTDPADLARGSGTGRHLLCVAAVTSDKGHQVLLTALAHLTDLEWHLTCVGSLSRDRELSEGLQRLAAGLGIAGRVTWTDSLTPDEVDKTYAASDLTVLASARESWGMVVTESLARGIPVVASDVGGVGEALGDGGGVLVPQGDVPALTDVLRQWLTDPALRSAWARQAGQRRTTLTGWPATATAVADVLVEVGS